LLQRKHDRWANLALVHLNTSGTNGTNSEGMVPSANRCNYYAERAKGTKRTNKRYLDAKAVMKMLGISPGTLRKKIEDGTLTEPVIGGGRGAKMIWKRDQFA